MKKVVVLVLLAVVAVFVTGRVSLGESGAMRFVQQMEQHMNEGDADAVCAMLHDELEITILDSNLPGGALEGGKDELCAQTHLVVKALRALPHTMNVTFEDVEVERRWLHPWTSTVHYTEDRKLSIRGSGVTVRTISEDSLTLVQTFGGVKLRKLTADVSIVP